MRCFETVILSFITSSPLFTPHPARKLATFPSRGRLLVSAPRWRFYLTCRDGRPRPSARNDLKQMTDGASASLREARGSPKRAYASFGGSKAWGSPKRAYASFGGSKGGGFCEAKDGRSLRYKRFSVPSALLYSFGYQIGRFHFSRQRLAGSSTRLRREPPLGGSLYNSPPYRFVQTHSLPLKGKAFSRCDEVDSAETVWTVR